MNFYAHVTCKLFASASAFYAANPGPKATVTLQVFSLDFLQIRCRENLFLLSEHFRRIYSILDRKLTDFWKKKYFFFEIFLFSNSEIRTRTIFIFPVIS